MVDEHLDNTVIEEHVCLHFFFGFQKHRLHIGNANERLFRRIRRVKFHHRLVCPAVVSAVCKGRAIGIAAVSVNTNGGILVSVVAHHHADLDHRLLFRFEFRDQFERISANILRLIGFVRLQKNILLFDAAAFYAKNFKFLCGRHLDLVRVVGSKRHRARQTHNTVIIYSRGFVLYGVNVEDRLQSSVTARVWEHRRRKKSAELAGRRRVISSPRRHKSVSLAVVIANDRLRPGVMAEMKQNVAVSAR